MVIPYFVFLNKEKLPCLLSRRADELLGRLIFESNIPKGDILLAPCSALDTWMKASEKTIPFRKTAACPSSATLLHFRNQKLSASIAKLVQYHLSMCDFCRAELKLLAHHRRTKQDERTPEIPKNLRILAESILRRT